jgi:hypothetical protein
VRAYPVHAEWPQGSEMDGDCVAGGKEGEEGEELGGVGRVEMAGAEVGTPSADRQQRDVAAADGDGDVGTGRCPRRSRSGLAR